MRTIVEEDLLVISVKTVMANTNSEEGEMSSCTLHDFLRKDARVEVATDDDGFKGAWFVARMIDPPRNPQSDLKEDRLALVEYQTLLSEDGVSLLVENVDANFIKPSPPQEKTTAKEPLKVNDIVDAFYLDGWWTGFVAEVKENGRYLVAFEDPPDAVELERADLRVHLDWIGGMWVRSKSKDSLHKQVSENQIEKSLLKKETPSTSRGKRRRPPKEFTDQNAKSFKKAAFSPVGEKINQKGKKMNQEPEAILKHSTTNVEENRSLPFAKTSPVWLAVDSMEVFKKFPQKPHFSPLHDLEETHREGLAIAHMVTFSNIVEKASRLDCSDPESSFHECLEALNDLVCQGFDIKPIELHLKKKLSRKQQLERFREEAKNLEERIKELSQANERIDEELKELIQKQKLLESKRGKNEMKVETLRKNVDGMRKAMELGLLDLSTW